jgi:hypothetical protein
MIKIPGDNHISGISYEVNAGIWCIYCLKIDQGMHEKNYVGVSWYLFALAENLLEGPSKLNAQIAQHFAEK